MKLIASIALLGLVGLTSADSRQARHPSGPEAAADNKAMQRIEITRSGSLPSPSAPAAHFIGSVHVVPLFRPNDPDTAPICG